MENTSNLAKLQNQIKSQWNIVLDEYFKQAKLEKDSLLVVGCSTSEVYGEKIGSNSSQSIGDLLFSILQEKATENDINIAGQCCEHLNRALIIERTIAIKNNYTEINVKPVLNAGGAFAVATFNGMNDPIAVEKVEADGALDIGDTLIGMHLKQVVVPLRLSISKIGEAHLTAARTRPKLIGGARAHYRDDY